MVFSDWFDPFNEQHMKALKQFANEGTWPKGFLPDRYVSVPNSEMGQVLTKLAKMLINNSDLIAVIKMRKILGKLKA